MSLDLINVGAEANDGTGDTPRAAFTKTNAAIAVVNALADAPAPVDYSGAIAALETTQGTQAGAIAALALDVDALETSQAGQDSAIAAITTDLATLEAGLATVAFSGAYADLSGKPVPAINYDQQEEPISPSVGQVWRERSAGGLIVDEWEWSGSIWMGPRKILSLPQPATNLVPLNAESRSSQQFIPRRNLLIEQYGLVLYNTGFFGAQNVSNHIILSLTQMQNRGNWINFSPAITYNTWTGAGEQNNVVHTGTAIGDYAVFIPINRIVSPYPGDSQFRGARVSCTQVVGSPTGTLSCTNCAIYFREIR